MKKYRYEQYAATRLFYPVVAYSPDGKHIAHINNTTGQFNLWTIPSGGGFPCQLTTYQDNTVRMLSWSPDGTRILFQADQNGDEQHQLYVIPASGGWPEALTDKLDSQHNISDSAWSPDGKVSSYSANDANPTDMDMVLRDLATGGTRRTHTGGWHAPAAWSPDGRYLTVLDFKSNTNQSILLLDVQTGESTNTTPHDGEIIFLPGPWASDNSGFYLLTNQEREFNGLAFYRSTDSKWDWVYTPDHDIEGVACSKDGRVLVMNVNIGGASQLRGRNLQTGTALKLPELPLGLIGGMDISPDGKRLAMIFVRPGEASNLYEVDLETGEMQALGQSMLGGIDPADMVEPELIEYPTFDGRKIPAWLYRPKDGNGPFPVVLSIHGGPEAQERPTYAYNGIYQYLLNRGFGVLAPNIRGSTGYGITYQKLIHRDFGGAELKDIEGAALYLQSLDWVDQNRIAVFGGSFGGFATLSAVSRLPEYWALGIDVVGPSNLLTFVRNVPPFWKRLMKEWVGDPDEDREMLIERSPITYVDNVRVPMLVIQGAKDPRVVKSESDQMVERLRQRGQDVRYYVDEEEGHGATRRANQLKSWKMIADYLEEYLLDEPA
jgi:dipeptidyl aminopeptidase/acylaminoacyl peptidase